VTGAACGGSVPKARAPCRPVCYATAARTDDYGRQSPARAVDADLSKQLDIAAARKAGRRAHRGPLDSTWSPEADGIGHAVTRWPMWSSASPRARLDVRDFAMVAYGGAGPLHAAFGARELRSAASSFRSRGHSLPTAMLVTDLRRDFVRSLFVRLADAPFDAFDGCRQMEQQGRDEIRARSNAVEIVVKHSRTSAMSAGARGRSMCRAAVANRDVAGIKAARCRARRTYGYSCVTRRGDREPSPLVVGVSQSPSTPDCGRRHHVGGRLLIAYARWSSACWGWCRAFRIHLRGLVCDDRHECSPGRQHRRPSNWCE